MTLLDALLDAIFQQHNMHESAALSRAAILMSSTGRFLNFARPNKWYNGFFLLVPPQFNAEGIAIAEIIAKRTSYVALVRSSKLEASIESRRSGDESSASTPLKRFTRCSGRYAQVEYNSPKWQCNASSILILLRPLNQDTAGWQDLDSIRSSDQNKIRP
jgi:hypothetical protein